MCDGRLFHRRAAATGNALSPTVDRRVRRTSRDVDEAERSRCLASMSALVICGSCNIYTAYCLPLEIGCVVYLLLWQRLANI